jgi:hypothetical protein
VAFREQLALVAVPVWRRKPLYQSYLIVRYDLKAEALADLARTTPSTAELGPDVEAAVATPPADGPRIRYHGGNGYGRLPVRRSPCRRDRRSRRPAHPNSGTCQQRSATHAPGASLGGAGPLMWESTGLPAKGRHPGLRQAGRPSTMRC